MSLISFGLALMAGLFSGQAINAQTLVLTKTPAVTDLYSRGVQAFPSTPVGTNSAVINLKLTVTGGAQTISSITIPTSTARIQQFTIGTITGCTVNGTTSNPTNTVCTVPVTFNPAYVGYQTSPLTAVTSGGTFQFGLNGVGTGPQAILLPGILSSIAGNGTAQATPTQYTGDGGQATAAQVLSHGFAFDALGNLYEAEYNADVIRKITPAGVISTVIGAETTAGGVETSTPCATPATVPGCGDNGAATSANFGSQLPDIALDSAGNFYVADSLDNRIRRVDAVTNIITNIAGTGAALTTGTGNNGDGGQATAADLNTPEAVLLDNADNIYMLNSNASLAAGVTTNPSVIRYIDSATGVITTLAGVATPCTATGAGTCGDGGQATAANLSIAASFYLDPTTGNMWIADRDANRIRFINRSTGIISTVAGTGVKGYTGDGGPATAATFSGPHGIWVDPAGDIYISDRGNNVVRYVSAATGIISTIAGGGTTCAAGGNGTCGDGGLSNGPAANLTPEDVRLDVNGNVYIADGKNDAIRKITTSPITLTFPSTAVGAKAGPLTATLDNIGTSTLTYTTPAAGSNAAVTTTGPTALPSNAFAQGTATTCGPIYSTTTTGNTLAPGATCIYSVTFSPDTATGTYNGTLVETDNSLNAGAGNTHYPTAATQTVNLVGQATAQTATITLASTPNPSTYGASVAFTATLSGVGAAPTGTVTFTYTPTGSTTAQTLGTGTLATVGGVTTASINYSLLPVGTDNVIATYNGDTNYASGTKSAADAQVVAVADGTKDTLTATPTTSTYGTSVLLTFTIPTMTGATVPSGTVTFTDTPAGATTPVTLGTGTISTAGGISTATLSTTTLPVGTDTLTANYPGDANYGKAAPTATEAVTQANGTDTLTANPASTTLGSPVTLTFTVPNVPTATAKPTGTVTFTSGGVTLGTGTLSTTGTGANAVTTATLTTSALPSGTDTVTAAYPGDTNYSAQSPTTTVTIGASNGADTLVLNPTSSILGTPVTATFTIPLVNGVAPTGTVTFTAPVTTGGAPVTFATSTIPASGVVTVTATQLPVGSDTITATYPGDANYGAGAPTAVETVTKDSTPDTLTANPTSSTYGTPVVLTFTVPAAGSAVANPTGTVTFTNGTTTLGTGTLTTTGSLANRVTTATLTTSALPVGSDTVVATYPGDANYTAQAPTATETVTKVVGTNDTLTYSPSAPTYGSPVTLTFTVPPVTGATATPTGTVTFTSGGVQLGTGTITTVGGVSTATITTTALPVGSDLVTATYPGDANYAAAAPTATVPVTKASGANDTLTASPTSSNLGSPVALTFTVPTVAGAGASPTGTVTFTNGTTTLGTGTLSTTGTGANAVTTATLTTSALPLGTDTVTGTYPGDGNYTAGSATTTETVTPLGTDTVTASPSPSTYGAPVTLTFNVPTVTGAATSPTGTVTFTSGGVTLGTGTINTVGGVSTATLTTTALPVGTDTITATYPGSPNYPAAAPTTTDMITKAGSANTDTLTANPTSSTVGSPVVLTFTVLPVVAGAAAPPTGTVTFTSGGVTLGTGTLSTTGTGANAVTTATLTTSTLPVGTDTVTGTYPGDANYVAGTATATETVKQGSGTGDTLTVNPTSSTYGAPVVVTFTVAPIAGLSTAPTGSVTFTSGTLTLGTGTISTTGGVSTASITTTALPVGSDLVTGTYAGDTNYGSAAPTATETVTKSNGGPGGPTLSVNPTSSAFGSPVVVTYNEGTVAGATLPATGTVVFTSGGVTLGTGTLSTTGTGANAVTTATITTSALPVGTDTVTGTYGGDTNYNGAAPTATETVSSAGSDTVMATPSPATYGAPVTLTFNVPTPTGATTNPTGTVTFTSGGVTLGTGTISTLNGVSTATVTTTVLPVGSDVITATYGGSPNYPAAAPTTTETINKAPFGAPNDTLTTSPNPSMFGQNVVITETLTTIGAAAPTGSVTFFDNGTSIGTGTITNGVATITTATLPVGTDPITATYTGDANYATGTSGPVNQVVMQSGTQATLAVGPNPSTFGTPVTITETITPINGTCPTGPATFLNNGTSIGTGVISLTPNGCVATLTTSSLPVGTDQITATVPASGGFAATTTGPVALVVNKANGADTLASSPNPSVFGNPVTITDTIPTVIGVVPTGTVNFFDFGTQIGTGTVNAQGVATLITSTLPVGTDSLTATYLGDGNYAQVTAGPVNQVVTQGGGTGATLAAGPNPTTFGTTVTITETIPTINGTPATGQVLFYQNGNLVGAGTLANGVASVTSSTLPVGTDPITATYAGDKNYTAVNSGPINEVINKANGPDTLAVSPDPAVLGATVTMTDTIPTVGGVAPTGTVTFYNNGTAIGTSPVSTSGVATLTSTTLPVGTDPITAIYNGDTNYATVTAGPVNEVITVGNPQNGLAASPNPSTFGTPVTITESITGINGISPTGSVTFFNGGTSIGTSTVINGVATLITSTLPIGTNPITATYTGDSNYATVTSGPLQVVVTRAAPIDTLTASPNPSMFGNPVTLTFTVPPVNGVAPTGVVSFYNGATLLGTGTVTPQGVATLTTSTLPIGTETITAKYPGDNNYAPSSPTVSVTVNQAPPTATLAVGPNPATYGTPVTLTEMITPINGLCPAGPTTFLNNGTVIGTGVISLTGGNCVATLTSSTLPVGADAITATVPASGGFAATITGPVALVITPANGADTLASSPNPSVFGSPVTITDTIPLAAVGAVAPTGTVIFYDFGTQIGTGIVNAQGIATLVTSTLPVGTDSLTATYGGDGNYAQVTAGPVNQVVTAVSPNPSLAVAPNPANFGTAVTLQETIPTTNNTPASGTVNFYQNGTLVGTGTLANGVASVTTTTLPVGIDPITATYAGDKNYAAANSGPVNETINKASPTAALGVNPDPAVFGSTVTATDTIPTLGGVAPTGTVTFYNNGTAIGTSPVSATGVATLNTTTLPVGSNPITAIYSGDANYTSITTGPVNEVITVGNSPAALGAQPNPATFGTPVTLTESINGINGVTPTGTVVFSNNGVAIGTATVTNGVATLVTSTLPIGTDPITATYSGDPNYAPISSGPLQVVINKAVGVDTVTVTPNPSTFGAPVTISFQVPPVNGVAPTGTVSFYDGTTLLGTGTVNAQGIATLTTSQLPFGSSTVTAKYPGDNNYAPASPTATVTVNPVSPTSVVTVPSGSPICGSSVTLTDTITAVNGVALGGTVQFYDNGTAIGSPVPVPASGVVTLTTSSLACSADVITAIYTPPAGSPYLPSTGGPTSITILNPDFSITATPPNQTVNPGDTTTYTVSLSGVNVPFTSPVTLTATGLPPGATVSFANGIFTPGAGPTSTTMTIVTAPNQAVLKHSTGSNGIFYGLLLLPLLGLGKVRRKIKSLPKGISYCLAALVLLGGLGAMTGCGGGYFGPAPQTFTITVTGTSGTLVHSTTVTLTVR